MERPPLVTTVELLDQVRRHLVLSGKPDSDYQVHKALNVSQPTVSDWRKGHTTMSDDVGFAVAESPEMRRLSGILIAPSNDPRRINSEISWMQYP